MMISVEVRGGLGDAFITFHETTAYERLEALAPDELATVCIISHNPFIDELFRWHPKISQIKVINSRYFFHEYDDSGKRADAGVFPKTPVPHPTRERQPIRFYPSPEDVNLLADELPKEPYLAIAPTASGMEIENRNIPYSVIIHICAAAKISGIPVVFLGRTYQGPHAPKQAPVRPSGHQIIDFTDRLSVPGTAEVVKRARATVCAHSALLLLSWFERKPNFALYPPKYKWHDFDNPSPFGFGKDYPETTRALFSEFMPSKFIAFLSTHFKEGNAP
jgi:hypothetical protein